MDNFQKRDIVDVELNGGNISRSFLHHSIGQTDNCADVFGVRVFRNGTAVDLTGGSVQGFFRDPQGNNILISTGNNISYNVATVVLPQACYNYEGQFTLAIKVIGTDVTGTLRIVDGIISNTNTGGAVAPTGTVPSYQEILATYDAMIEAIETAEGFNDEYAAKMKLITGVFDNNVLLGADFTAGGYYDESNELVDDDGWWYSDLIPVEASTQYLSEGRGNCFIQFYNSSKNFLNGYYVTGENQITSEATAAYMRVSLPTEKLATAKMFVAEYQEYGKMAVAYDKHFGVGGTTIDCNAFTGNTSKVFNANATLVNGPANFDDWQDGSNWKLVTIGPMPFGNDEITFQFICSLTEDRTKRTAERIKYNGWQSWSIHEAAATHQETVDLFEELTLKDDVKGALAYKMKNIAGVFDNNILLGAEYTKGGYYDESNDFVEGSNWWYSDLIPVEASTQYLSEGRGNCFIQFYNSSKTFLNGYYVAGENQITSGATAAYMRVSLPTEKLATARMFVGQYQEYWRRSVVYDKHFGAGGTTIDCNAFTGNTAKVFNTDATLVNGPEGFDDWQDGSNWQLVTIGPMPFGNDTITFQYICSLTEDRTKRTAERIKYNGWQSWSIHGAAGQSAAGPVFHVGTSQQYTRLRDGIAAAMQSDYSTVFVHPGTYDLVSEFATEIATASGFTGIGLGKNIHVIFYDGAKVEAKFTSSGYTSDQWSWIYNYFQPFYALMEEENNYILENLDIEAWDCRYCVHDENGGARTYKHEYKNCRMKYKNTHESDIKYVQCIGGGLGLHGTITIDGGYYKSETAYGYSGMTAQESQQPISFHNGAASGCDSSINIKDVYLADKGYFRFGYYGTSTIVSEIMICGCSMGAAIVKRAEDSTAQVDNFNVTEWNNLIRT